MTEQLTLRRLSVFVPGNPKPQGSKTHLGNGVLIESSRDLGSWRERIALFTHNARIASHQAILHEACSLELAFILPRPLSASKTAQLSAAKRPDLDKLVRGCCDAITNVLIASDAQIVRLVATKRVAAVDDEPGVRINLERVLDETRR